MVPLILVGVVLMIVVPVPASALDRMLATSIALSVALLLISINIENRSSLPQTRMYGKSMSAAQRSSSRSGRHRSRYSTACASAGGLPKTSESSRAVTGVRISVTRRRGVDVTTEIVINKPSEAVSAYASDPSNAPEWYVNIKSVEWQTSPPLRVGARLKCAQTGQA